MNNNTKPLVTVTVSSYNHQNYIKKTIESIINQSYGFENIELITIDDCSTDDTGKILKELSRKYDFRFFQNESNKGVVNNMNSLLRVASGKYIAGCASDDYWHIEKLEKQVSIMEAAGVEYAVCHTKAFIIDTDDNFLFFQDRGNLFQENIIPKILTDNGIVAPSVLIKKSVYDAIGLYDESLPFEDREMWIRMAQYYKFIYINEPLVYRRHHPNNLGRNINAHYESYSGIFKKYYKLFEEYNKTDEYHFIMFNTMAGANFKIALKHLSKSWRLVLRKNPMRLLKLFTAHSFTNSRFGLKVKSYFGKW